MPEVMVDVVMDVVMGVVLDVVLVVVSALEGATTSPPTAPDPDDPAAANGFGPVAAPFTAPDPDDPAAARTEEVALLFFHFPDSGPETLGAAPDPDDPVAAREPWSEREEAMSFSGSVAREAGVVDVVDVVFDPDFASGLTPGSPGSDWDVDMPDMCTRQLSKAADEESYKDGIVAGSKHQSRELWPSVDKQKSTYATDPVESSGVWRNPLPAHRTLLPQQTQ
ncbi:unnamed protein product [Sphagnum tenellum]